MADKKTAFENARPATAEIPALVKQKIYVHYEDSTYVDDKTGKEKPMTTFYADIPNGNGGFFKIKMKPQNSTLLEILKSFNISSNIELRCKGQSCFKDKSSGDEIKFYQFYVLVTFAGRTRPFVLKINQGVLRDKVGRNGKKIIDVSLERGILLNAMGFEDLTPLHDNDSYLEEVDDVDGMPF